MITDVGDNMLELCNVSRAQLYLAALPPNLLLWAELCLPPTSIFILKPRTPVPQDLILKVGFVKEVFAYTMEYYSAIKKNSFESVLMRWMNLEPIIQSEVSQKDKDQYSILMHIYGI